MIEQNRVISAAAIRRVAAELRETGVPLTKMKIARAFGSTARGDRPYRKVSRLLATVPGLKAEVLVSKAECKQMHLSAAIATRHFIALPWLERRLAQRR